MMKIQKQIRLLTLLFLLLITSCDNSGTDSDVPDLLIPKENLEAATQYALFNENGSRKGRALLIWHKGELILEEYEGENFNGQSTHPIFSGSKSFAGLLAAIAVKNGLFSFETTLGELIPEWDPETERGKITIRDLLNLSSGIQTASVGAVQTAEQWLQSEMEYERGTRFVYGPTPFYLLSWIFVEVFEINPVDYLNEHLFTPLGVVRGEWSNMDQSYPNFAYGGQYPALDWLQIGILLMNNGTLNGEEIIPPNLMNDLLTPGDAHPGYGITFWLNRPLGQQTKAFQSIPTHAKNRTRTKVISDIMPDDLFMKSGFLGQKLYIVPSLNLVIVRFGLIGEFSDNQFFSILMDEVDQNDLQ